jgi:hypothetical protein
MNEKEVLEMKFGETVADGNGNKYTKTIGGWIYSTFAGNVCFIPEGITEENSVTEKAEKKAKEK